jgi:hypothetical protein
MPVLKNARVTQRSLNIASAVQKSAVNVLKNVIEWLNNSTHEFTRFLTRRFTLHQMAYER